MMVAGVVLVLIAIAGGESIAQVGTNTVNWGVEPQDISRVGAAGFQFLKLPTDARSAGMGGIKSAVGFGNANSAFNNPASTVDVTDMDLQFTSMKWVAEIQYNSMSFVKDFGDWGTIGVNAIYVNYGDMIRTKVAQGYDAAGNDLGILPITEGLGTFTAHDLSIGISYARQITRFLQVGGSVRYVEQQIDDATMRGWALDVGTMYWTGLGSLRISMLGRNFGPDGEYKTYEGRIAQAPAKVRMPMIFIFGMAYDIIEASKESDVRMTAAAEYVKPNDGPEKANAGLEFFAFSNFYLRGGYRFNYDEEGYTLGFGAEYSIEEATVVKLDFAYANAGRFGSIPVLSLGLGF